VRVFYVSYFTVLPTQAAFLNDSEAEVAVDAIDRANALVAAESSSSMGQGNGSSSDGGNASAMTAASLEKALCESLAHRYSGLKGASLGRKIILQSRKQN